MSFVDFMLKYGIAILSIVVTALSILISGITSVKKGNSKGIISILEQIPSLVKTAEDLFGSGKGTAKLDYVLTQLRLYALQNKIKVDNDTLTNQINAIVDATNNVNINKPMVKSKSETPSCDNEPKLDTQTEPVNAQDTINI